MLVTEINHNPGLKYYCKLPQKLDIVKIVSTTQ